VCVLRLMLAKIVASDAQLVANGAAVAAAAASIKVSSDEIR